MKWKKLLAIGMTAVMTAAFVSGCGSNNAKDAGGSSSAGKKIVVGLDDNFPPMGFKDENNEIVGFDIDLAKEATKRLGREVEFKAIDWSSNALPASSVRIVYFKVLSCVRVERAVSSCSVSVSRFCVSSFNSAVTCSFA